MISMIAAVYKDNGIGKDNQLPANIKQDLQHFKRITEGHVVIMGYNTYLSLPKGPLPNRTNVILTRKDIAIEGAVVLHSIEEVLAFCKALPEDTKPFIIGGASVYEQFMPYAERLYITHVFHEIQADTFFPPIDQNWQLDTIKGERENIEHPYPHIFAVYEKESK